MKARPIPEQEMRSHIEKLVRDAYSNFQQGLTTQEECLSSFSDSLVRYLSNNKIPRITHAGIARDIHRAFGFSDESFVWGDRFHFQAYLQDCSSDQASLWIKRRLSDVVQQAESPFPGAVDYHGRCKDIPLLIRLAPLMNSWLQIEALGLGHELPWASEIEWAKDLYQILHIEVLCDPGTLRPRDSLEPHIWWHISKQEEGLFSKDLSKT